MKRSNPKQSSKSQEENLELRINKMLDSVEDAAFFKKKMEKGAKMLAVSGLPK